MSTTTSSPLPLSPSPLRPPRLALSQQCTAPVCVAAPKRPAFLLQGLLSHPLSSWCAHRINRPASSPFSFISARGSLQCPEDDDTVRLSVQPLARRLSATVSPHTHDIDAAHRSALCRHSFSFARPRPPAAASTHLCSAWLCPPGRCRPPPHRPMGGGPTPRRPPACDRRCSSPRPLASLPRVGWRRRAGGGGVQMEMARAVQAAPWVKALMEGRKGGRKAERGLTMKM